MYDDPMVSTILMIFSKYIAIIYIYLGSSHVPLFGEENIKNKGGEIRFLFLSRPPHQEPPSFLTYVQQKKL